MIAPLPPPLKSWADHVLRNFKFDDVHAIGAQRIARICAENSVPRFVHVSHLNADINSPSAFYRSKARGEEAVKAVFPEAIIIRPGPMYGQEDKLLNNMACTFSLASALPIFLMQSQSGQSYGTLTVARRRFDQFG